MHTINDAIVVDGKLILDALPFPDGQHVSVTISAASDTRPKKTIDEIQQILKGGLKKLDDPGEPMIPLEDWDAQT